MERVLYCTDLHGSITLFERIFELAKERTADVIINGGDLSPKGGQNVEEMIQIQKRFFTEYLLPAIKNRNIPYYCQMGNDDLRINMGILESAEKRGILKLLGMKKHDIGGFALAGYPFINRSPFRLKDWEKKEGLPEPDKRQVHPSGIRTTGDDNSRTSIIDDLEKLSVGMDMARSVFVIHPPPYSTCLDISSTGEHVGSIAVRGFIEEKQPLLSLHGHIHESPEMSGSWKDNIGSTVCVNPGRGWHEEAAWAVIIELDTLRMERVEVR